MLTQLSVSSLSEIADLNQLQVELNRLPSPDVGDGNRFNCHVISLIPVLAVIMPIFSNTSGTVGIQSLTVTIRGLGMGKVTPKDTFRILRKEILAGLGTSLVLGLTLVMLSLIWASPQDRWVALVAGLVMSINVLVAVTLGTLLPLGFKRLYLDPALCSGPMLTTLLDGVGFMIFLTLISVALKLKY